MKQGLSCSGGVRESAAWGSRRCPPAEPGQAGRCGQRWAEGANALPSSAMATRAGHPDGLRPPRIRARARCRCRRSPAVDAGARCGLWEPRPRCAASGAFTLRGDLLLSIQPYTVRGVFSARSVEAPASCAGRASGQTTLEGANVVTVQWSVRASVLGVSASRGRSAVIPVNSATWRQSLIDQKLLGKPTAFRGPSRERTFLQLEQHLGGHPLGCGTSDQRV